MNPPDPDPRTEEYVLIDEAAKLLGRSPRTLRNALCRRDPAVLALRPTKVLGTWRWPMSAIREAFRKGRYAATGVTVKLAGPARPKPRARRSA